VVAPIDVIRLGLAPGRRVDDALRLVWEMVANATVVDGGAVLRTTGTIDFRGARPVYSATPANELVYLDAGIEVRVVVDEFDGDFDQESATDFFVRAHDVVVRDFRFDGDDFDAESHLGAGGAGTRSAAGAFGDGTTFSLSSQQAATFDFGNGTVETEQEELRTGTVGGRAGLALTFEEQHAYRAVLVDNLAEDLQTGLAISGTAGGTNWSMTDALLKRTFRNGRAVEPDFWLESTGRLFGDGRLRARIAAVVSAPAIELTVGDEVLERHAR
jgi:hypothetical protein